MFSDGAAGLQPTDDAAKPAASAGALGGNMYTRRREEDGVLRVGNRKSFPIPTLVGDGTAATRSLTWADNIQDNAAAVRSRPYNAAFFAHTLHPMSTLSAVQYGMLSDLDLHVAGAMEVN